MLRRFIFQLGKAVCAVVLLTGCANSGSKKDAVAVACQDVNKILSSGDVSLDSSFASWVAEFKVRAAQKGSNLNGIQAAILTLNASACRQLVTGAMRGEEYNKFLFALTTLLPGTGPEGQALAKKVAEAGKLPVKDVMEAAQNPGAATIGYETALKILLSINITPETALPQPDNTPLLLAQIDELRASVNKLAGDIRRGDDIEKQKSPPDPIHSVDKGTPAKVEVEFASGKSELTGAMKERLKKELIPFKGKQAKFTVFGYADKSGSPAVNELLSRNRAYVVARWITDTLDVPWTSVEVSGFGSVDDSRRVSVRAYP